MVQGDSQLIIAVSLSLAYIVNIAKLRAANWDLQVCSSHKVDQNTRKYDLWQKKRVREQRQGCA
jgi:hypothetical protein